MIRAVSRQRKTATLARKDPLAKFKERPEHELNGLSDEKLIEYIKAAREAGAQDALITGLGVLAFRYWDNVQRRVRMKIPTDDVDDVTSEIITNAIASNFSGGSVGEFKQFLNRITERRIADFYRRRESRPETDPLPEEHEEDDEVYGGFVISPDGDHAGEIQVRLVFGERID